MSKRIMVDPGHGGRDPGARASGIDEADVALVHGAAVADELRRRGHSVRMTRTSDEDLGVGYPNWRDGAGNPRPMSGKMADLVKRCVLANEWPADLFVSLHCNAAAASGANGCWLIYDDKSRKGKSLGEAIFRELAKIPGIADKDVAAEVYPDNSPWTGERDIRVVSKTSMPAVLVELGFLTNGEDLLQLCKPETPRLTARAIADGIEAWLKAG